MRLPLGGRKHMETSMKKLALSCLLPVLALTACQADPAEIADLRADVDALKLEVFGNPLAYCPEADSLTDTSAYQAALNGLPDAELETEEWHKLNADRDGVITLTSGLKYSVIQEGIENGISPVGSQQVTVNYHGFFRDGKTFDSSYDRGQSLDFPANGVISGWVEALQQMKPCEARTLYVPSNLAYGEKGRGGIPADATLMFHVQLLKVAVN